jgi:hypothetical protein
MVLNISLDRLGPTIPIEPLMLIGLGPAQDGENQRPV